MSRQHRCGCGQPTATLRELCARCETRVQAAGNQRIVRRGPAAEHAHVRDQLERIAQARRSIA